MIVDERGEQIIGRANGVQVASEMQIDVLHGYHLSVTTASSSARLSWAKAARRSTKRSRLCSFTTVRGEASSSPLSQMATPVRALPKSMPRIIIMPPCGRYTA